MLQSTRHVSVRLICDKQWCMARNLKVSGSTSHASLSWWQGGERRGLLYRMEHGGGLRFAADQHTYGQGQDLLAVGLKRYGTALVDGTLL